MADAAARQRLLLPDDRCGQGVTVRIAERSSSVGSPPSSLHSEDSSSQDVTDPATAATGRLGSQPLRNTRSEYTSLQRSGSSTRGSEVSFGHAATATGRVSACYLSNDTSAQAVTPPGDTVQANSWTSSPRRPRRSAIFRELFLAPRVTVASTGGGLQGRGVQSRG